MVLVSKTKIARCSVSQGDLEITVTTVDGYNIKLHIVVRLQFWSSEECGPLWPEVHVRVLFLGQIDLFRNNSYFKCKAKPFEKQLHET